MIFGRILSLSTLAFVLLLPLNTASAADRGIFKGKTQTQHELTKWEKNKMTAELKNKFSSTASGAFQKLNNNPWEAKRSKQKQHSQKMLQLSNTWGACREFAYKQRGQCYARGGDAYTCERYYDARSNHCDQNF